MDIKDFLAAKGLPEELAPRFEKLTELALGWNEKINITAIKDPGEFMEKNVIDSLTLCGAPQLDAAVRVLDLGTGGGYPGLPLAMAYPKKSFVLVDSVGKKLKVIDAICGELEIANVSTVHARAEELAFNKEYREKFDLVTSRAVAALPVLCEYCLPFVRKDGYFAAYKTGSSLKEVEDAGRAVKILGGTVSETATDGIEGSGHLFVFIKKTAATPKAYPRKAGVPTKQPL